MGRIFTPAAQRSIFLGGATTNIAASTAPWLGLGSVNTTLSNVAGLIMPYSGVFTSLWVRTGGGGNIGATTETWLCELFLDNTATPSALAFTMTGAVSTGNTEAFQVPFTKGQYVLGRITASAGTSSRTAVMAIGIA